MPNASLLKLKDFRLVTQSVVLVEFGIQIQSIIIGWQIYEIKHDPLYLGVIGLVEAVPALSLALLAGHIVDQNNPLKILKGVICLNLLSALLLFIPALGISPVHVHDQLLFIYGAAFISGVGRSLNGPAIHALVPRIVPREFLKISAAWTTSAMHIATIIGPPIGGLLYAWRGALAPYSLNLILFLAAILFLTMTKHVHIRQVSPKKESVIQSLSSGLRFVFKNELLLSALTLDMFAVLFGGAVALLPIFADDILHVGPTGLGMLRAAPAIGALIMSGVLIRFPVDKSAGRILLISVAGFGLATIGFGLSQNFILSLVFLGLTGAFDSVSMVIRAAIVPLSSPNHMRGRIAAVNSIFIGSSNELGAFESGFVAKLMGTVPSVIFGGTLTLVTIAVAAVLSKKLRRLNLSDLEI